MFWGRRFLSGLLVASWWGPTQFHIEVPHTAVLKRILQSFL